MNTLDTDFFIENIRAGYEQRKARRFDKGEEPIEIIPLIHELIKNSNQIVHNRGKALSYLSNKRKDNPVVRNAPYSYGLVTNPRNFVPSNGDQIGSFSQTSKRLPAQVVSGQSMHISDAGGSMASGGRK